VQNILTLLRAFAATGEKHEQTEADDDPHRSCLQDNVRPMNMKNAATL